VIALLLLALQAAPEFTRFEFARERVGHRVVAEAQLVNLQEADLADARVVVVYYDRDLELKRSKPVAVPRLPSGKAVPVKIEVEQLPNFSRYRVYVDVAGRTWEYLGEDPTRSPVLRKAAPAKLSLVESKREDGALVVTVRNLGELEAREPVAVVGAARVRLAPELKGATEARFRVEAEGEVGAVAWTLADGPAQKDEKDGPQLALRGFRTAKLSDGSVRVEGAVRNGFERAVEKVVVTFKLGKTSVPLALPGALAPGEVRPFEAYVADAGPLDGVGFELAYADGGKPGPVEGPRAPSVRLLDSRPIEIARAKLPEPAQEEKPKADAKPSMQAAVTGLMEVKGFNTPKSGKYTGDVYYLKVAFTDAEGKPAKPNATLNAVMYDAGKEPWKVQRIATKEAWKVDAGKLNNLNAEPNLVVCDPKTGELWIGLVRTDGSGFTWKIDLTVTVREAGTWTFKGMAEKYEAPAKPPDKK
jgi:hypothetical protein